MSPNEAKNLLPAIIAFSQIKPLEAFNVREQCWVDWYAFPMPDEVYTEFRERRVPAKPREWWLIFARGKPGLISCYRFLENARSFVGQKQNLEIVHVIEDGEGAKR